MIDKRIENLNPVFGVVAGSPEHFHTTETPPAVSLLSSVGKVSDGGVVLDVDPGS